MRALTLLAIAGLMGGWGCSSSPSPAQDPKLDPFYAVTRHIMTDEELEIYRHLPDSESRQRFASDFWEKRDPDPTTDTNEALEDFNRRIEFANRYFDEKRGKNQGWDSLRGRILLQLGFPDERQWGNTPLTGEHAERRYTHYETWLYLNEQLQLVFVDKTGFGQYDFYGRIPATLGTAIENAKRRMMGSASKGTRNAFRFDADYKQESLRLIIPSKHLSFNETEGDRLSARFTFTLYIYRDHILQETLSKTVDYTGNQDEVINLRTLDFTLALPLDQSGRYFLDIIGKDEQTGERARTFCKVRK